MNHQAHFNLYATPPHECSYLPDRQATTVFIDPLFPKDAALYDTLSQHGFRRSGEHLYRPHCQSCDACLPVRIPVNHFTPKRSQKRVWQANQDLQVKQCSGQFQQAHFELYQHYLSARHQGGGMDNPTPESYHQFLISSWSDTVFYEFRLSSKLLAVAVLDRFENGLSAVYTFFHPDYQKRSLGTFALLWEIQHTRELQLEWLYLGYWIQQCQKMSYKIEYQPLEFYQCGIWQRLVKPKMQKS